MYKVIANKKESDKALSFFLTNRSLHDSSGTLLEAVLSDSWVDNVVPLRCTPESVLFRCPKCGGECRVIACIDDPTVIRKILNHMGLSAEPIELAPARGPPIDYVDVPTAV